MGRFIKLHWVLYCILVFILSRIVMLYQFNLANDILSHVHSNFFMAMCKFDCRWYLTIINNGYDTHVRSAPLVWKGLANWAFFPLYPLVVKYTNFIFHSSPLAIGSLLNQAFILVALQIFYLYLKLFVDELNSRFGVFLLAFSPFSIYFASLYTEALFLLLSLSAFYFLRTNRPYLSAFCGGLLSATRPVGIMFSVPYLYSQLKKSAIKLALYGTLLSCSGLFCYMLYLYYQTGDALAFHHIQKEWGRTGFNSAQIGKQLLKMLLDYHNSVLFIFSVGISIYLIWQKYFKEAIFNLLCIIPGVLTGSMMSEGRFCGTLFTFYFALVLLAKKSNSLKITLAIIFLVFYISYFIYWLAHARFLI